MRQQATVEEVRADSVVLSVRRESACSGECHKCAGCGAVAQTVFLTARNPIGARKGDRVYVQSSSSVVLWAAVLVYLLPLIGFFCGYLLGSLYGCAAWLALAGFVLGWLPAVCYNRYIKKQPPNYTIIGFVE